MKTSKAIASLAALAQESRLNVFLLLLEGDENGVSAGDIAQSLDVPATTMSFHLAQLKSSGLIESRKEGRSVIYTPNRKKIKKLCNLIQGKS